MRQLASTLLIAGLLLACGAAPPAEDVVATFRDGSITRSDIDRTLLTLGGDQTRNLDMEQLEQLVRRLAVQRVLLAEARRLGLDQEPEHQALLEDLRHEAIVTIYLERHPQAPGPPTAEELQAYYDEHAEQHRRSARRVVYHLFKRYPESTEASHDQVRAEVAALRQRAVQGEPFPTLAAAYSDSESRHYEGLLGIIEPGQLPPQLDAIVFALKEGVPSEPISTKDGVHLFWVESAVPEQSFALDEVQSRMATALQAERSRSLISELVRRWQEEVPVVMPDQEQLQQALSGEDEEATILSAGDYRLTVGRFRSQLRRAAGQGGQQPAASPQVLLESIRRREIICQHLLQEGEADTAEAERRVTPRADNALATRHLEQRLNELLDAHPERVAALYERSKMRFATPLRLQLRRLVVPLGPDPGRTMTRLEAERSALDRGEQTLEQLAGELGGEIEDLGWQDLQSLQRIEPKAVVLAGQLAAGQHSSPFRSEKGLELIAVLARQEPQARPLAEVEAQVRRELLLTQGQQLYDELEERLLAEAGLQLLPDRLQALLDTGFGGIATGSEGP